MQTSILRPQFSFPTKSNLTTITVSPPQFLSIKASSHQNPPSNSTQKSTLSRTSPYLKQSPNFPVILGHGNKVQIPSEEEFLQVSSYGFSRFVILSAVSIGFAMFLVGMEDQKALALGPEGPLMEEFWDNMRRYGLYFLTVSTGALYTIFQPILELLKNPISAVLIITILGGSLFIVSQVLSAMVGVSEFAYDYSY